MFLEEDNIKKDSLFLKGSEVAKNSVLKSDIFTKLVQNSSIGDSTFKYYQRYLRHLKSSYHQCIGGLQISYGT